MATQWQGHVQTFYVFPKFSHKQILRTFDNLNKRRQLNNEKRRYFAQAREGHLRNFVIERNIRGSRQKPDKHKKGEWICAD